MHWFTEYMVIFTLVCLCATMIKTQIQLLTKKTRRRRRLKRGQPEDDLTLTKAVPIQKWTIEQLLKDQSRAVWPHEFDDDKAANILEGMNDETFGEGGEKAPLRPEIRADFCYGF
jgi:hypothetical protein